MRIALALAVSALLGNPCWASGCIQQVRFVRQNVIEVQPAQAFFFVAPPSYYGATAHGAASQQVARSESEYDAVATDRELVEAITKLASVVTRLDARLQRLEQAQGLEPIPPPDAATVVPADPSEGLPADAVRIVNDNCRFCHGSDNLPDNKGGFSLSQMWRDQGKIDQAIEMVAMGHMPATGDGSPARIDPSHREVILSALEQIKRSQR
jgi:hypothetical protein